MKATGIFLRSDIADLKVDQPAPEILEAIGPALLARGTEELRVRSIYRRVTPGEIAIKLDQSFRGREVVWSAINTVRETLRELGATEEELSFPDTPARLAYEFEKIESSTVLGGALVWIFSAQGVNSRGWFRVCVDAATGKLVRLYPPVRDP